MSRDGATGTGTEAPEQFRATPNAEKYILEADALRRRQLGSALIHGSDRTWRERRRMRRHLILRVVSVAGRAYRVNLSVPDQRLNASQPILDEVARSFTIR